MQRFRVWALVSLIAIVDFGHIAPGFAQTQEDDSISSASGRGKGSNITH